MLHGEVANSMSGLAMYIMYLEYLVIPDIKDAIILPGSY